MAKYKKKFARQLNMGLRNNGKSVDDVCQIWGVSRTTYYNWVNNNPEFALAHEIGERDYASFVHNLIIKVASGQQKGNAGILCLMAKNILGWKEKSETQITQNEEVRTININVLPPKEVKTIEHQEKVQEAIIKDNVIEFINDKS